MTKEGRTDGDGVKQEVSSNNRRQKIGQVLDFPEGRWQNRKRPVRRPRPEGLRPFVRTTPTETGSE